MADQQYDFFVSTIVPAMNEQGNIDEFCDLFAEMLREAPFDGELVYVDDGSTDGTLDRIKENARKYNFIRFASHQHNRGLTAALQTGFSLARGDVFVFYPADLQFLPEDIPALVKPIAEGATDCFICLLEQVVVEGSKQKLEDTNDGLTRWFISCMIWRKKGIALVKVEKEKL